MPPHFAPYIVSVKAENTVTKEGLTEKKLCGSISTLEWLRFEVTANLKFRFRNISAFKSPTKLSSQNSFVELSTGINQTKCFSPIFTHNFTDKTSVNHKILWQISFMQMTDSRLTL